jgi:hypothetical protein
MNNPITEVARRKGSVTISNGEFRLEICAKEQGGVWFYRAYMNGSQVGSRYQAKNDEAGYLHYVGTLTSHFGSSWLDVLKKIDNFWST